MLKDDLKIDLKIQKVFNYDNIKQSKNTFDEKLWNLLNENESRKISKYTKN